MVSPCVVWLHRNFFHDLLYTCYRAILDVRRSWRFKTPSSAINPKWHAAPYFPRSSSSSTPGSAKHIFSEKKIVISYTDYVLDSTPGSEQLFAEHLGLSLSLLLLLLHCEFHVVYYSPESLVALPQHKKSLFARKVTSKPVVA